MVQEVATFKVKKGLAQMLKGGVIMDVVTADHAKIAEDAGAVAVMALERVPADIRGRRCGPDERPRIDPEYYGCCLDPGDGQMPDRAFCRSADPRVSRCGLH